MFYCYFNDEFVSYKDIKIPVDDLGFQRGYGIFDVVRTYGLKPFLLDKHLDRFFISAKKIGLKVPIRKSDIGKIIQKLIFKTNKENVGIKLILTAGEFDCSWDYSKPNFIILTQEPIFLSNVFFKKGVKLMKRSYIREFPEIKSLNYLFSYSLQKQKQKNNAFEILYVYKDKVLEASSSNFFMVKNKKVITAKKNILKGCTRNLVINLCRKNGIKVVEREIEVDELKQVDEVFITATYKQVLPVVKIDGMKISNGKVGSLTNKIMQIYDKYVVSCLK